jgi:hypothetical protein
VAFQAEPILSVVDRAALQVAKEVVPVLLMIRLALYPVSQEEVT